ncbi:MAG: hypothetical protein FD167_308 [bacterium]|nr:MAG: hypothetical protein FD167_308 [bacterium]
MVTIEPPHFKKITKFLSGGGSKSGFTWKPDKEKNLWQ